MYTFDFSVALSLLTENVSPLEIEQGTSRRAEVPRRLAESKDRDSRYRCLRENGKYHTSQYDSSPSPVDRLFRHYDVDERFKGRVEKHCFISMSADPAQGRRHIGLPYILQTSRRFQLVFQDVLVGSFQ
jgi:hypothetical protein